MKKISQEELNEILKKHKMWLKDKESGKRADLRGVNLSYADLSYVYLKDANLSYADLSGANLWNANLSGTNLYNTDLSGANLWNTDLSGTNLEDADLSGANLMSANLWNANLRYSDLRRVDLRNTNLEDANLMSADLRSADLRYANLRNADLRYVKTNINTIGYNLACPDKGSFIGYKKANDCIIELLILEDSKRSSATTAKCRCDKAKVLDIEDIDTGEKVEEVKSSYDKNFIYRVGEIIKVDDFDDDRWNECAPGIHFFVNRENAINY